MDYRPVSHETADYRRFLSYAFRPTAGPPDLDEEPPVPATVGEGRGLFDRDELLTVCRHYWFTARVAGTTHPMAGLSAVATPPEHRRQGLVRELVRHALEEYRDRGHYLAALWPFKHPFYAQFGWALANRYALQEFEPSALAGIDAGVGGTVRPVDADEHDRLGAVLDAESGDRELFVERTEEWWRKRVFHGWDADPYVYGWERDGELRGYLIYTIDDAGDDQVMRINELAAVDREARQRLYRFVADHDSQVARVRLYGPADARLLDEVDDPGEVEATVRAGPMVRLVDVPAAIAAMPTGATGGLTIAVSDPLAGWNEGRFRLDFDGEHAACSAAEAEPDARCDVGALAQLYVGYRSVDDLAAAGALTVGDDAAREVLRAAFPPRRVFLREGF